MSTVKLLLPTQANHLFRKTNSEYFQNHTDSFSVKARGTLAYITDCALTV